MNGDREPSVADGRLLVAPADPVEVRALYDAWADRYEEEVDAWDYRTPTDVAEPPGSHRLSAATSRRMRLSRPYLPKSDEMGGVGVVLCVLRTRE